MSKEILQTIERLLKYHDIKVKNIKQVNVYTEGNGDSLHITERGVIRFK